MAIYLKTTNPAPSFAALSHTSLSFFLLVVFSNLAFQPPINSSTRTLFPFSSSSLSCLFVLFFIQFNHKKPLLNKSRALHFLPFIPQEPKNRWSWGGFNWFVWGRGVPVIENGWVKSKACEGLDTVCLHCCMPPATSSLSFCKPCQLFLFAYFFYQVFFFLSFFFSSVSFFIFALSRPLTSLPDLLWFSPAPPPTRHLSRPQFASVPSVQNIEGLG